MQGCEVATRHPWHNLRSCLKYIKSHSSNTTHRVGLRRDGLVRYDSLLQRMQSDTPNKHGYLEAGNVPQDFVLYYVWLFYLSVHYLSYFFSMQFITRVVKSRSLFRLLVLCRISQAPWHRWLVRTIRCVCRVRYALDKRPSLRNTEKNEAPSFPPYDNKSPGPYQPGTSRYASRRGRRGTKFSTSNLNSSRQSLEKLKAGLYRGKCFRASTIG